MSKKWKVYVTRQIPHAGIELLQKECVVLVNPYDRPLTREELLENIKDADGVLCLLTDKIDVEVFDTAKKAKGFANYAVGYDNMDVEEATKRGIPLSNTPGVLTDATADMAWALLFAVARRIVEADKFLRSGSWGGWGPMQFLGADIQGKTLGIVGAGRIGTAMALKSRGFDMQVLYHDEHKNEVMEEKLGAKQVDMDTLLKESDFISIHAPLLPSTRHMFDMQAFKKMKNSAYLINTARGPLINESELATALKSGLIAGAGLDVYEFEPKVTEDLLSLNNVVLCPHIASATTTARTNMALIAARNLLAMLKGEKAPQCINPKVYGDN
ncbi:D-glycerate dehydrogenase [Spirochaetia bacterium 38H-sp]|uniref:D-glycerate dehydrogenase n=1 Tax=Rarispira pelagica TaxID=3141764 RepID=A0ABU9UAJ7_9SPIR